MSLVNDKRESFPSLEDASGEGVALRAVQVGDLPSTKNGAIGFAFRDSTGAVVLPQLLPDGTIAISNQAPGTALKSRGEILGSNITTTTIVDLTLGTTKTYADVSVVVACFNETLMELVQNNNGVLTVLCEYLVGPGSYTVQSEYPDVVTTGATGTQKLLIRGQNLKSPNQLRAFLRATELA